jgi:hypothetical protein
MIGGWRGSGGPALKWEGLYQEFGLNYSLSLCAQFNISWPGLFTPTSLIPPGNLVNKLTVWRQDKGKQLGASFAPLLAMMLRLPFDYRLVLYTCLYWWTITIPAFQPHLISLSEQSEIVRLKGMISSSILRRNTETAKHEHDCANTCRPTAQSLSPPPSCYL